MNALKSIPPSFSKAEGLPVRCPTCKSNNDVYRIPRNKLFKLLRPVVDIKHYKCTRCMKAFYR